MFDSQDPSAAAGPSAQRPAPDRLRRRAVPLGWVLGAVVGTAVVVAGATYLAVNSAGHSVATTGSSATSAGVAATPAAPSRTSAPVAGAGGGVARPWLGIRFETIDAALKQANNLPVDNGAWIPTSAALAGQGTNGQAQASQDPNAESSPGTDSDGETAQGADPNAGASPGTDGDGEAPAGGADESTGVVVLPGSPAAQAGLQAGDIITAVDGAPLDTTHPLDKAINGYAPGTTVTLDVLRNGQTTTVSVTLGTRPSNG